VKEQSVRPNEERFREKRPPASLRRVMFAAEIGRSTICQEEFKMNRLKVGAMIFCFALFAIAFPRGVKADEWNKKTVLTFDKPFEIPGVGAQVLPAGTYVFKLLDSQSDRHIVQIFNERQDHVFSTILAIPNYRLRATDKTVITFRERAAGQPEALRAWFYPGNNWGQEFVYPKARAIELAKQANLPVLAMPTELAPNLVEPVQSAEEPPVIALKQAPIEAVTPTGEVVAMTEVVEPPPVQTAAVQPAGTENPMPNSASLLPLLGLIGFLSLAAGAVLSLIPKRIA